VKEGKEREEGGEGNGREEEGREGQPPKYFGPEPPLPGGRNICRHCPPPLRYATLLCFVESCI